MTRTTPLVLVALAACAGAQSSKTIPSTVGPDGLTYVPYVTAYGAGRLQQVIAGASIANTTAILREIRLRADSPRALRSRTLTNLNVWIGVAKTTPTTLNANFAANRGTRTLVFNGRYSLPAQSSGKKPFNLVWKLTTPYLYSRSSGDLLLEWEAPGQSTPADYFLDAQQQGPTGRGGSCTEFGRAGQFRVPEVYRTRCEDPGQLAIGGNATLFAGPFTTARPALAIWGFSKTSYGPIRLPFDLGALGAPNNFLHVSIDLALPMPMRAVRNACEARSSLPIPRDLGLAGQTLYAQAMFRDAATNRFGWVTSAGVSLTLERATPIEANHVGSRDANAKEGLVGSTPSAVVMQLVGAFR